VLLIRLKNQLLVFNLPTNLCWHVKNFSLEREWNFNNLFYFKCFRSRIYLICIIGLICQYTLKTPTYKFFPIGTKTKSNLMGSMFIRRRVCISLFVCLYDSVNVTIAYIMGKPIMSASEYSEIPASLILKFASSSSVKVLSKSLITSPRLFFKFQNL
jgi:hypothetical protein